MKSGTFLAVAYGFAAITNFNNENKKQEILDEWERSKNYPRKKKKRVRKELQVDWSIACFDPFDFSFLNKK
jgi:hypothetical protein